MLCLDPLDCFSFNYKRHKESEVAYKLGKDPVARPLVRVLTEGPCPEEVEHQTFVDSVDLGRIDLQVVEVEQLAEVESH
jgi:hypothetical protein